MQVFPYSLHVSDAATAERCGARLLLRRSVQGLPMLAAIVKSADVVKASADALQRLLTHYQVALKKNSTKSAKIKELLKLEIVLKYTTTEERQTVLDILTAMDNKRNKRQATACQEVDADEEAGVDGINVINMTHLAAANTTLSWM